VKSKFLRLLVVALLGALVAPLPAVLSKSSIPAAVAADANTTTAGYQFNVTFNPPQAASGAWTIYMASTQTGTTQISIIKSIAVITAKKLTITGYASPTSGEDDIRISLDRALEVKKAILKLHPGLSVSVNVSGAGTSKASACTAFANRCVVVSTL